MPDEQHWHDNLLAALADLTVAIEALTAQLETSTHPSLRARAHQAFNHTVQALRANHAESNTGLYHRPILEPGLLDDLDPNDLVTTARSLIPGSSATTQDPAKRAEDGSPKHAEDTEPRATVLPLTKPHHRSRRRDGTWFRPDT